MLDCRSYGSRRLSIARANRAAGRLPSGITALLFVISNPIIILYIQSVTYFGGWVAAQILKCSYLAANIRAAMTGLDRSDRGTLGRSTASFKEVISDDAGIRVRHSRAAPGKLAKKSYRHYKKSTLLSDSRTSLVLRNTPQNLMWRHCITEGRAGGRRFCIKMLLLLPIKVQNVENTSVAALFTNTGSYCRQVWVSTFTRRIFSSSSDPISITSQETCERTARNGPKKRPTVAW